MNTHIHRITMPSLNTIQPVNNYAISIFHIIFPFSTLSFQQSCILIALDKSQCQHPHQASSHVRFYEHRTRFLCVFVCLCAYLRNGDATTCPRDSGDGVFVDSSQLGKHILLLVTQHATQHHIIHDTILVIQTYVYPLCVLVTMTVRFHLKSLSWPTASRASCGVACVCKVNGCEIINIIPAPDIIHATNNPAPKAHAACSSLRD